MKKEEKRMKNLITINKNIYSVGLVVRIICV